MPTAGVVKREHVNESMKIIGFCKCFWGGENERSLLSTVSQLKMVHIHLLDRLCYCFEVGVICGE